MKVEAQEGHLSCLREQPIQTPVICSRLSLSSFAVKPRSLTHPRNPFTRNPPWKMYSIISTPASKFRQFRRLRSRPKTTTETEEEHAFQILWRHQILDPDSDIVAYWNKVFLVTSLLALFVDPLYFFLPTVGGPACLQADPKLSIIVTIIRSFADLFYVLHMLMKFRTAFVAPNSRIFGRGELVMDSREIATRYLKSDFVIDLAATIPLPQIVIWLVIPASRNARTDHANNTLALFVLIQYVPRLFLIFHLNQRIQKTTGVIAKTPWIGAAYNLILYMLASHVTGATWYLSSIGRQFNCWKTQCQIENKSHTLSCFSSYLDCNSLNVPDRQYWLNITHVITKCDAKSKINIKYKFGMFAEAFLNDVVISSFKERYFYCLWWGLRNLSSYGQNLDTTTYLPETLFCIVLCIAGLVLFSLLIGNMETYLSSMTVRLEEWRIKKRDTEEWMRHRQLPPHLQERVRRFVQYKWLATRGVDEEAIMLSLPLDLRREIQHHLCLSLVRRVPFFSQMDDQLLDAICERLSSSLSTEGTYIFREGDPVDEMLFIIRGQLESSTTNGGRSGFFNCIKLRPGDFCGEELLTWALMPNSTLNLPSSTRTVKALSEVEAFSLQAEDLKFVASQFKRLHSKKLQHAFRYYSHQWRTWGACFIQAAWRRHQKRKATRELSLKEGLYYLSLPETEESGHLEDDETGESSGKTKKIQNLGATVLASKFAANTRKGAHKLPDPVPQLFKPDEPDFSLDHEL
ncbi:cyclic nucleotide-gated ion channel 18 [Vigna radiata var. radiata]|uniref:Cyclic nucleotide-gated ion channel 18 n=1 Tax=Vigna radiata var. radiata TaxID=3916 RepID=A0A1S3TU35_VIGRR|nr:cyclic nucleotide-gated ion channel 18 [Vigna radiata var. radiata]